MQLLHITKNKKVSFVISVPTKSQMQRSPARFQQLTLVLIYF